MAKMINGLLDGALWALAVIESLLAVVLFSVLTVVIFIPIAVVAATVATCMLVYRAVWWPFTTLSRTSVGRDVD